MYNSRAFVLMTALPPTKGHLNLIRFADSLANKTIVIVCTQPSEPYSVSRFSAISQACKSMPDVMVRQLHKQIEQDPAVDGFWPMWVQIMKSFGFRDGDYVVTSEPYGQTLADLLGGVFIPYDVERRLYYTKATAIRESPERYFSDVLPEFQPMLRRTVTVFGAESTGKTTLSHELSVRMNGHWLFEYARPYLELVGSEITSDKMNAIWVGQRALQRTARHMQDKPWVIQDTDLYSTVGYWDYWGGMPYNLPTDAMMNKSDLYLVTQSNIAFEPDPLRYGGDHRELPDEYWIRICKDNNLNYRVLTGVTMDDRLAEAESIMRQDFQENAEGIVYDRKGL